SERVVRRPVARALAALREWEGPGAEALLIYSRRLTACPPLRWPICRRVTLSWSWQPKVARTARPQRLLCLAAWSPSWRPLPTPMPPRFLRLGALAARPAGKRPHPDAVPAQSISLSFRRPDEFSARSNGFAALLRSSTGLRDSRASVCAGALGRSEWCGYRPLG